VSTRSRLLECLAGTDRPRDPAIPELIGRLEREMPADLGRDATALEGVWELRWSSSDLPYLTVAPWLENLQVLAPSRGRGMNLLRLRGPLAPLAAISVVAEISVAGDQRVQVRFLQGGWLGPRLGARRLSLLRQVRQATPAWLDITVLDEDLRICRGNAGTLFALTRRRDLTPAELLPGPPPSETEEE
jgi:hypothetical protein